MTELVWDDVGTRFIEHGTDRGVIYPGVVGVGVPWHGLTGVDNKSTGSSPAEYYFDSVKYISVPTAESFAATLKAFTYPDEFSEFDGIKTDGNGLYFDQQLRKEFGISYRTMKGNDLDQNLGYKIHLVYNALVSPTNRSYVTNSNSPEVLLFSWDIITTPIQIDGYRPTAHLVIDSTKSPEGLITYLEGFLYGTEDTAPHLPTIGEIVEFASNFDPRIIEEDELHGLAPLDPGLGDLTGTNIDGVYTDLPNTRLIDSGIDGLYKLEED